MSLQKPLLAAAALAAFFVSSVAGATSLSFTTVFGNIPGPTPSAAAPGDLAADVGLFPSASVLGPIDNFTDFSVQNLSIDLLGGGSNEGQIIFLQNGGFYVGGAGPASGNPLTAQGEINLGGPQVNNRAYGVFGPGRSDFTFDPLAEVTELDLQVRGTATGLNVGGNAALGQSLPENSPLVDADATVLVYTNLGLQVTSSVSNAGFETLSIDVGSIPGDFITRVSLVNEAAALNSAIVLGELTVGTGNTDANGVPVPEPTSLALLGLVAGAATVARRR